MHDRQREIRDKKMDVVEQDSMKIDSAGMMKDSKLKAKKQKKRTDQELTMEQSKGGKKMWTLGSVLNMCLGLIVMMGISCVHSYYMYQLHENYLWFSNIKEVEREISFRTETGLYYSYFKQMVKSPSLLQGVKELMYDKMTEHPDTINILERMNIYQEVFLAFLYKTLGVTMPPILFYAYSVFCFHGFLVSSLYLLTWLLSNSWLAGLLSALFYIFNRIDTTRVEYSIALRESFALPFLWMQAAALTVYFKPTVSGLLKHFTLVCVMMFTFLFCLCWQFNQFIMMLQSFALFGVWLLGFLPADKARNVMLCQLLSLLAVCVFQFGNKMILGSLAVSFLLVSVTFITFLGDLNKAHGLLFHIVRTITLSILSLFLMVVLSNIIKASLNADSDEHVFKFLQNKFGIGDIRDFDARMYLCLGIFGFISIEVFERLSQNLLLPFYLPIHVVLLTWIVYAVLTRWIYQLSPKSESENGKTSRELKEQTECGEDKDTSVETVKKKGMKEDGDEEIEEVEIQAEKKLNNSLDQRSGLAFHTVQATFFAALAILTMRMKYFWTPYMCVLSGVGVADERMWTTLLSLIKIEKKFMITMVRSSVTILVISVLIGKLLPPVQEQLKEETEFWDPDTVELMEWIIKTTPPTAAFTGSMQLLAGVKLCTGRPITNHPHYEDKYLRLKTKELYQIYGRRSPEDVHAILTKYKSNYIILEDSICRAPSKDGCRTPDIVDIDNGVIPDNDIGIPGLVKSNQPRFCEAVRYQKLTYGKYFKPVMTNKTFRVYKVLQQSDSQG